MTHISFKANTGKQKPNTFTNTIFKCPFCDWENLRNEGRVIKETDEFMIVKNKYPVIENTYPTVIIEHKSCDEHIGTYSNEYLTRLLEFILSFYDEINKKKNFTSCVVFKNSGLFSGGSIKHQHFQLIGFYNDSYKDNIKKEDFEGVPIISDIDFEWNISTKPRSEFYEINFILSDKNKISKLANCLQITVNYVLQKLNKKYQCYNLAFYLEEDCLKIKLISRSPNSILLLAYDLQQTPNNLDEVAYELKTIYDNQN